MGAEDRRKIGKITVKVVHAKNLKNQELLSKSDPYCKVMTNDELGFCFVGIILANGNVSSVLTIVLWYY